MTNQDEQFERSPWLDGWRNWRRSSPHWLADHLLPVIVCFIAISPFIFHFVSSGFEHLFFPELNERRAATLALKQYGLPQACDVIGASGTWMSLRCAGKPAIAPLAGIQLPANRQEAQYVTTALEQIWKLTTEKPSEADLKCGLQQFEPTDAASKHDGHLPKTSFAVCTLGGRSLPDILLSSGMSLTSATSAPLRLLDSSSQPLPGYIAEPSVDGTTYVYQEAKRTTLLAIEGWMATILGFAFASFSIFYTQHEKSSEKSMNSIKYRQEVTAAFYDFQQLDHQITDSDSSEPALAAVYQEAAKKLKVLQGRVRTYDSHIGKEFTEQDRQNFEYIHRQLLEERTPDPPTVKEIEKTVKDLLQS